MAGNVIDWPDVTARYAELDDLKNAKSPEVRDNLMLMAEAEIHSRLASRFSVPFTAANFTARGLCIDMLYVQNMATRQPEKAKLLMDSLDGRITDLLEGKSQMIDSGGAVVASSVGDTVWGSDAEHPPVFGKGDIMDFGVSSQQLYDEAQTRGDYL